jgi:hypothetical protein
MARASAILRCLALASRYTTDEQIDVAELVDAANQLVERAIDRLDGVELLKAISGRAVARDERDVSPVALFGGPTRSRRRQTLQIEREQKYQPTRSPGSISTASYTRTMSLPSRPRRPLSRPARTEIPNADGPVISR